MESLFSNFTVLTQRASVASSGSDKTAISIVAMILGFVFLMTVMNYRRRMAEIRYKTIERLAHEGQLTERQIDEFLGTKVRRTAFFMVIGWLAMFVGIALTVLSQLLVRGHDMLIPGVFLIVVGLGVISTPIMLREMRKQEIL